MELLKRIDAAVEDLLEDAKEAVILQAHEDLDKRIREALASVTLSTLKYYDVEQISDRVIITVRGGEL